MMYLTNSTVRPHIVRRILIDAALLLTAFVAPWYVGMIGALIAVASGYVELVLAGIILDALYNGPGSALVPSGFTFTAILLVTASVHFIVKHVMGGASLTP